jgi:hypothetical protein
MVIEIAATPLEVDVRNLSERRRLVTLKFGLGGFYPLFRRRIS